MLALAFLSACSSYPRVSQPPAAPPEAAPTWLRSPDGLKLYWRVDLPPKRARAIVWIVQGSEITSGVETPRLLGALAQRGIGVAFFHARGTGYSEGVRGDVEDFGRVLDDYRLFARELQARYPGLPVFLFGHSAGGSLALGIAARQPDAFRGLVLVNPAYKWSSEVGPSLGDVVRFGFNSVFRRSALTVDFGRDPSGLADPSDRRDAETLRRDPLVVRYYSMRYLLGLRGVLRRCPQNAARLPMPLLFVQGARDKVIDPAGGREIFDRSAAADKRRIVVPDLGHGWAIVEARADEIAAWIAEHVAGGGR